jgi:hypothetical protein
MRERERESEPKQQSKGEVSEGLREATDEVLDVRARRDAVVPSAWGLGRTGLSQGEGAGVKEWKRKE